MLYHVTLTAKVRKIMREGLRRFMRSNWVRGDGRRYGNGEVFAFEDRRDAIRWAGKMDWHLHQGMGTGKISVVEFIADTDTWQIDESDPLSQAGRYGRWLKCETMVPPIAIHNAFVVTTEHIQELIREQSAA